MNVYGCIVCWISLVDDDDVEAWFLETLGLTVDVTFNYDCSYRWEHNVYFKDVGVNPPFLIYDTETIIHDPQQDTLSNHGLRTVYEGGLKVARLAPNWIRGVETTPQVTVTVGSSPAMCKGDCSFDLQKIGHAIAQNP